ncbi:MAG: hypothetical protein ACTHLR_13550 [Rhizomicrobium sp.]
MNRQFFYLKASVLVLALAIAGLSTGFRADRLAMRFDALHYSAVVQANATLHCASHGVSHAFGKLFSRFHASQALVLSS